MITTETTVTAETKAYRLELWDSRIVLLEDGGDGFDTEATEAPTDYDVPAELVDEYWRLHAERADGERFGAAVAAEARRHYGGRFGC